MSRQAVALACAHIDDCREPFATQHPWYLLVELASSAPGRWLDAAMTQVVARARD